MATWRPGDLTKSASRPSRQVGCRFAAGFGSLVSLTPCANPETRLSHGVKSKITHGVIKIGRKLLLRSDSHVFSEL